MPTAHRKKRQTITLAGSCDRVQEPVRVARRKGKVGYSSVKTLETTLS